MADRHVPEFFARLAATLERAFIEQFARDGQPLPK